MPTKFNEYVDAQEAAWELSFHAIFELIKKMYKDNNLLMSAIIMLAARDGWEETIIPAYIRSMMPPDGDEFTENLHVDVYPTGNGEILIRIRSESDD